MEKFMNIEILQADYLNQEHGKDMGYLMNCYSEDPMGGGESLSSQVITSLASELAKIPHAFSLLCYVDGKPAGLINCFECFSTFSCKPLINIHDVVVVKEFRGLGISSSMLSKVAEIAKAKGCCKVTLEVLEGNEIAQGSYKKSGFSDYVLDPSMGRALFWQKAL